MLIKLFENHLNLYDFSCYLHKVHGVWVTFDRVWSFDRTSINSNIRFLHGFYCSFIQKERVRFPSLILHICIFSYHDTRDLHLRGEKKDLVASISIARRKYVSRLSYNAKTRYNCRQREIKRAPFAPFLSPPFHLDGWCLRRIALYRGSKSKVHIACVEVQSMPFPSRSALLFIKNFEKWQSEKSLLV